MSFMSWLQARKPGNAKSKNAFDRARNAFRTTTMPLISPRRGRRLLRREQLFGVVRESLIRGGVLSTSYSFKVLNLDSNGDSFIVLVDLALPAQSLPDEFLLEIERWIQQSAKARHTMDVRAIYWRRKPSPEQVGQALRASVAAQTRRESALRPEPMDTSIPRPPVSRSAGPAQRVSEDEVRAFRAAMTAPPEPAFRHPHEPQLPMPEAMSDFAALSETQHGKL
ncbi:hypothetical protein [Hydrogenophaga sp. T2]|uniref:hypothetical protein n=1 Tax=Hydrogenophaga sp. T2 TaxID=3132823 RepID=UPI003CE8F8B7